MTSALSSSVTCELSQLCVTSVTDLSRQRLCGQLGLDAGSRVLDVGTGPGGSAIHMASRYACHVTGIDLSANMVTAALQRQAVLPPAVSQTGHTIYS